MTRVRTHSAHGQVLPSDERRRSQRVMIRVPVTLYLHIAGQEVRIRAETVAVNDHGAMLLCARSFGPDTRFELQNDRTLQQLPCRVTRAARETPEGFLLPVEFIEPWPGFWQISFPPTDWKPPDD